MYEDVEPNSDRWFNLKDLQNEKWKDIEYYEGLYQVSNYGRVKSLEKISRINGRVYPTKIMKNHTNTKCYYDVDLCENGAHKRHRIHRLVAENFIINIYNKPQVNHIDGNKQNNRVDNLEWCNNSENQQHAFANGLNYRKRYGASPRAKRVNQYDKSGNLVRQWDCITRIYEECGYNDGYISQCCKGKYKQAYGYVWKYKEDNNGKELEI